MEEYWKDITTPQFEGEIWKDIPGFEGEYQVSNLGRVKGLERIIKRKDGTEYPAKEIIHRQFLNKRNYLRLCLHDRHYPRGRNLKNFTTHRLVMLAFKGESKDKQVDHIDGNTLNNTLCNLRYCTPKENTNNPISMVRRKDAKSKYKKPIIQLCVSFNILYA